MEQTDEFALPDVTARQHSGESRLPVGESVMRGALALLSTQPLTWGASLLTTALVPRLLGAEALGEYTFAFSLAALLSTGTSLGISEFLVRRLAQKPEGLQRDLGVALLLQLITGIVAAIVLSLLAPLIAPTPVGTSLVLVSVTVLLLAPAQCVLLSSFRGRELHTQYAWFNAATVVVGQLLGIVALLLGGDVLTYAIVQTLANVSAVAIGWKFSKIQLTLPSFRDGDLLRACRELALGGFPFLTWLTVLAIMSGIDRVLLGIFVPAAEVGWYAAAYRIFAIPVFIPNLIITPLYPALSRSVSEPHVIRRTVASTLRVSLLLLVPLTAGTIVLAPAIPNLLGWPPDFANAVPVLIILSLQLPIVAVDMVFGVVLMAIGLQNRWVAVGVVAAALKILINLAAIPLSENLIGNGGVGASLVTLVTELVMFIGAMVLIPKNMLDFKLGWVAAKTFVAGAATVVVGSALLPHSLVLAVAASAITYPLLCYVTGALTKQDVSIASRYTSKFLPVRA
jgi:O-antigen/teichoic acid export membrane protein